MNWITGIQRALDYVEAHLMESVDYEEAAKQAYSSSFHFQRVFSILCGFTLGDYIRMRRLTLAGLPAHLPKKANSQPGRIDGGGDLPILARMHHRRNH